MRVVDKWSAAVLCLVMVACSDDTATPGADSPPGLWHPVRGSDQASPDAFSDLSNLPYLRGSQSASAASAVTVNDADAAYGGLNLVVSGHAPEAVLLDMNGNTLHTWRAPLSVVRPGAARAEDGDGAHYWRRVHLYPSGDLLVMFDGIGLAKIDQDSKVLWRYDGPVRADFSVAEDGTIYVLERRASEDFVVAIGADGEERSGTSVAAALRASDHADLVPAAGTGGELTLASALEVLDERTAALLPSCRAGNVLVALPGLPAVAVVDLDAATVVWLRSGPRALRSRPMVLSSGKLLIFDSAQPDAMSRVEEIDPVTGAVGWKYQGSASSPLASYAIGSCQRLPNGNTLIVESEAGRAFEVTADGDVVWEYFNPHQANGGELIASLCGVQRIENSVVADAFPAVAAALRAADKEIDTGAVQSLLNGKE